MTPVGRRTWVLLGVVAFAFAACTVHYIIDKAVVHHHRDRQGDWIFSVSSGGGGGFVVHRLPTTTNRWSTTFGVFHTCTKNARPARLEKVTWSAEGTDAVVTPYLRLIPPESQRIRTEDYDGGAERGTPWTIKPKLGGRFLRELNGHVVRGRRCGNPPKPEEARADFVMVVTAGPAGAKVDKITVHYTADGRRYALDVGYELIMCGTEVTDPEC